MTSEHPSRFRFGEFELDSQTRELRRTGIGRVPLQDKPFDLLLELVRGAPGIVSRERLRVVLWGEHAFVDAEHGINTAVRKLREALGDDAESPHYVETVARHGYRFRSQVQELPAAESAAPAAPARTAVAVAEAPLPGTASTGTILPGPDLLTPPQTPVATRQAPGAARLWARVRTARLLAAFLMATALVTVAAAYYRTRTSADVGGDLPAIRSLAVLPLANLSGDPGQDYFADGMTDALITELARVGAWRVTSRTSVMSFKGKELALPRIASDLDVDAVVEGSVVRAGDRVRVTVQLLDARADRHLWADEFERRASDVLLLQAEIATAVARQVSVQLRRPLRTITARPVDPGVYNAYLRGRYFWNKRTTDGFRKAIEEFERVVRLDPGWAPGWAGLGDAYGLMAISGYDLMPPAQAMPRARDAARRALALDDGLAQAHTTLAWVSFTFDRDFAAAESEFRSAIELDPNYATAHQWYSNYLCAMGRIEEARAEIAEALALDPLSLAINNEAAWPDYYARRLDESDAHYQRTLELDPSYPTAHLELGMNMAVRGRFAAAVAEYEHYIESVPGSAEGLAFLAHAEAGRGRRARALALRRELGERARTGYVSSYAFAVAELGLGHLTLALDWLERARDAREDALLYLGVDPLFDPLRAEPRFRALLRDLGLQMAATGAASIARPAPASGS